MLSFSEYLYNIFDADENKRLIFIDNENLCEQYRITEYFENNGFVVFYDIEKFCNAVLPQCKNLHCSPLSHRLLRNQPPQSSFASQLPQSKTFGEHLQNVTKKILLITKSDSNIPKEIESICVIQQINYEALFPELNPKAIKEKINSKNLMNLLCMVYYEYPPNDLNYSKTIEFIFQKVLTSENIYIYVKAKEFELDFLSQNAKSPFDWYNIANIKADLEFLTLEYNLDHKQSTEIFNFLNKYNFQFQDYITSKYSSLPSYFTSSKSPILVNNVLSYIRDKSSKFALIVMDGMSILDWKNISQNFKKSKYKESFVYAMLPTITSISRQSLLAGKFPKELSRPWDLANEEKEFRNSAKELGFKDNEVCYLKNKWISTPAQGIALQPLQSLLDNFTTIRGGTSNAYDDVYLDISFNTKCLTIIINDIDDLVHESQNKTILYNSIKIREISQKLENIVNSLLKNGFYVYITADHGNTQCLGIGKEKKFGVETASKGKRMLVLKDFANQKEIIEKYNLIKIPKDYLMNEYDYFVCSSNSAFENKNVQLMSHGGITLEEVIVPFIEIRQ